MPRRSSRAAPASAPAPAPAPKRRASERLSTSTDSKNDPKRRKSEGTTGQNLVKTTTKTSKFFQEDDPEESAPKTGSRKAFKSAKSRKGGAKSQDDSGEESAGDTVPKDKQLWREGVTTGLGPGKEVFIKKPKAKDAGNIPYEDHTLHPNTLEFLEGLSENNERSWLKAHDADYQAARKDWESFVVSLSEKISDVDSTIPELPAKDMIFRIHRDVRFTKDPTPYKPYFSAAWSRTGKKGPYASYYVHCQPGSCIIGAGLWQPDADQLALLREDIDRNSHGLKAVLNEANMRREILNGVPDDEEKAVKEFLDQNKETALKIKPKGYDVDNENIKLLRLRNFTISKPLADEDFRSPDAQDKIAALIGVIEPFVTYLNSVVMPDAVDPVNHSGSESSDDSAS
ncbi:hypothetical protein P170DRAFT_177580 [Aspergillus steynii IBT 23096]|uniref:Uncharacterized protein n=1 Tax=Aspergillus steynii IBT 23096 TaxID=1392250 RepID=A0A2I2G8J9_9EURO|nr:uncharacterized protein P170DRAFT_177580 [Aspergillus steynii IBT 23096]PLB49206.1 hypothetical protein P170DRAFT_177580 [Aspergillus steynii IBT 23096]